VDPRTGAREVALSDARELTFAPDGSAMAYLRWHQNVAAFTLNSAAPDGSGERELTRRDLFPELYAPRFSPDGRQIIFISAGGPPTDEQGYPIRSSQSPLDRVMALFAPAVAEAHGAKLDLWLINTDGTGLRRLAALREDTPMAVFSPDGSQIVVMGAGGIYLLNADGSNLRVIDPLGDHGGLDWVR
jgi:Tol biopolymer transport system component